MKFKISDCVLLGIFFAGLCIIIAGINIGSDAPEGETEEIKHVVTDKWISDDPLYDDYMVELDNQRPVKVTEYRYRNLDIGDIHSIKKIYTPSYKEELASNLIICGIVTCGSSIVIVTWDKTSIYCGV